MEDARAVADAAPGTRFARTLAAIEATWSPWGDTLSPHPGPGGAPPPRDSRPTSSTPGCSPPPSSTPRAAARPSPASCCAVRTAARSACRSSAGWRRRPRPTTGSSTASPAPSSTSAAGRGGCSRRWPPRARTRSASTSSPRRWGSPTRAAAAPCTGPSSPTCRAPARWATALLLDGNNGIGGSPPPCSPAWRRCSLRPGGGRRGRPARLPHPHHAGPPRVRRRGQRLVRLGAGVRRRDRADRPPCGAGHRRCVRGRGGGRRLRRAG
jgi:hypothetical protein